MPKKITLSAVLPYAEFPDEIDLPPDRIIKPSNLASIPLDSDVFKKAYVAAGPYKDTNKEKVYTGPDGNKFTVSHSVFAENEGGGFLRDRLHSVIMEALEHNGAVDFVPDIEDTYHYHRYFNGTYIVKGKGEALMVNSQLTTKSLKDLRVRMHYLGHSKYSENNPWDRDMIGGTLQLVISHDCPDLERRLSLLQEQGKAKVRIEENGRMKHCLFEEAAIRYLVPIYLNSNK